MGSYLLELNQHSPVLAILATLVCVLIIGTSAQILAERLRLPSTGPLLIAGLFFGPDLIGLVQPEILRERDILNLIVRIAVAIIVFEGGLLLNIYDLRHASRAVTGLVTVGLLITTGLAGMLAHFLIGLSWEISLLFGATVSVTGPTVITPILRKVKVNRRVKSTLESESIIADPLGVILAAIIFTAIIDSGDWTHIIAHGMTTVAAGAASGIMTGLVIWLLSNRFHLLPSKFTRLGILGSALVAYTVAELIAHESGVLAAAIAGIAVGSLDIPHKEEVEEFKGDLASISISAVFILLAASLRLNDLISLGWQGPMIVLLIMLLVRPVRVFVSTIGSELKRNEKIFISLLGPRGIVAASVATFFALELADKGYKEGANVLVTLVFAVILGTVLIEGSWANWMSRFFKVMPRLTIIIGADETARLLAGKLIEAGESVSIVDTDPDNCAEARQLKEANVYCEDATEVDVLRKAGVGTSKAVIVATSSDKVNILISQVIRSNFGDKRIVARANTTSNVSAFREAGIETMSPVQASAAILENMVLRPSLFQLLAATKPEEEKIDEVEVRSRRSIDKSLAELHLDNCLVVALRRHGDMIQPSGTTVLRYGDILTILGDERSLEKAKKVFEIID
ncbi:MAG: cation:proton antiporter [Acidobacteriota bacterium]|nr:cation:proton antiporter [Acidobacteriota bacterium]